MQVPKPVGDEVELAEDDPRARLHLLQFITEVEDNSHLKHKNKSERERPLPGVPTIGLFWYGNIQQRDCVDGIKW